MAQLPVICLLLESSRFLIGIPTLAKMISVLMQIGSAV